MKFEREDAIHFVTALAKNAINTLKKEDKDLAYLVAYKIWADCLIDEYELDSILNYIEKGIKVQKKRMLIVEE